LTVAANNLRVHLPSFEVFRVVIASLPAVSSIFFAAKELSAPTRNISPAHVTAHPHPSSSTLA